MRFIWKAIDILTSTIKTNIPEPMKVGVILMSRTKVSGDILAFAFPNIPYISTPLLLSMSSWFASELISLSINPETCLEWLQCCNYIVLDGFWWRQMANMDAKSLWYLVVDTGYNNNDWFWFYYIFYGTTIMWLYHEILTKAFKQWFRRWLFHYIKIKCPTVWLWICTNGIWVVNQCIIS